MLKSSPLQISTILESSFSTIRENTPRFESGGQIARINKGGSEVVLFGRIANAQGAPLPGAQITVWQTAADGRYDFLLAACPLPVRGGVGGPVNPLAVR